MQEQCGASQLVRAAHRGIANRRIAGHEIELLDKLGLGRILKMCPLVRKQLAGVAALQWVIFNRRPDCFRYQLFRDRAYKEPRTAPRIESAPCPKTHLGGEIPHRMDD